MPIASRAEFGLNFEKQFWPIQFHNVKFILFQFHAASNIANTRAKSDEFAFVGIYIFLMLYFFRTVVIFGYVKFKFYLK